MPGLLLTGGQGVL